MSAIASATYARASIDSTSPCSPYAHITRDASTAAAACARSYASTWCSSSFGDRELAVVEARVGAGSATAASTTLGRELDRCDGRAFLVGAHGAHDTDAHRGVGRMRGRRESWPASWCAGSWRWS